MTIIIRTDGGRQLCGIKVNGDCVNDEEGVLNNLLCSSIDGNEDVSSNMYILHNVAYQ